MRGCSYQGRFRARAATGRCCEGSAAMSDRCYRTQPPSRGTRSPRAKPTLAMLRPPLPASVLWPAPAPLLRGWLLGNPRRPPASQLLLDLAVPTMHQAQGDRTLQPASLRASPGSGEVRLSPASDKPERSSKFQKQKHFRGWSYGRYALSFITSKTPHTHTRCIHTYFAEWSKAPTSHLYCC